MIDPENKYCPQCDCEYMPQVEECAACKITLITGQDVLDAQEARAAELALRKNTFSEEDDLVTIRRGSLNDLRTFGELLEKENITCLITGDEGSCGKGCCAPTLDILVRRQDAPDAVRIIEEEIRRTSVFDEEHDPDLANAVFNPDEEEAVCPACGHRFPTAAECPDCGLCF